MSFVWTYVYVSYIDVKVSFGGKFILLIFWPSVTACIIGVIWLNANHRLYDNMVVSFFFCLIVGVSNRQTVNV
jgi:dolichol kinase